MSIRILHVVDTWAVGGLQNGVANLIERMNTARFEHVICTMRPVGAAHTHRVPAGTQVVELSVEESRSRFQAPALARKIREVKPDIVHTRNWGTFEALLAACRVGGCARVHSEHGIDWDTTEKESWRRLLCRRLAFQLADRVLSVSSQLRDMHAKRTGFSARKIEVIRNGVDTGRFFHDAAARNRVRGELGIGDAEFCIGCVGNLIPVKDHLTLFRAVAGFAQSGRPWRLLVAGAGPELPKLTAFTDAHPQWKERVLFLGRSNAVPELLNAMDAYVLPSLTEGISNSLLEAMATGLAVVATDTGGNPEVVAGGESGLLFPVGDAARLQEHLLALEARGDWRRQLAQGALSRVRNEFSLDGMVRKYEAVYESFDSAAPVPISAATRV